MPPAEQASPAARPLKIGFIGSMNAMPMSYALKFRRDGHDVRYVVEAPRSDYLMRPEHQYPREVGFPYPSWIFECVRPYGLVGHAFAGIRYAKIVAAMADRDVVFLNDYGLALAPHLPARVLCIALSSGSDVDVYCSYAAAWSYSLQVRRRWLFPARLALEFMRCFNQRRGLKRCDVLAYFPEGLNEKGDRIVREMVRRKPRTQVVRRYDLNFQATGATYAPPEARPLRKILVPVRFNIHPPTGSEFEYKGNDLIIEALAAYKKRNPAIEVHLFDKGVAADIDFARELCRRLDLESSVVWHKEVPLEQLLRLYEECDVCFDQVGSHWMGAIGCLALYTGRPLIANARLDVFAALWGDDPPILHATTVDQICAQLVRCEDPGFRAALARRGHDFAVAMLDTENVYRHLRDAMATAMADQAR